MNCNMEEAKFEWFSDGVLNASINCIDRHMKKNPDKVALIWEQDEPGQEIKITYQQLSTMTNKIANLLKDQGVKRGDIVAIYMPVRNWQHFFLFYVKSTFHQKILTFPG